MKIMNSGAPGDGIRNAGDTIKVMKWHELANTGRCHESINFSLPLKSSGKLHIEEGGAVNKVLRLLMNYVPEGEKEHITEEDVEAMLEERLRDQKYDSETQKRFRIRDHARRILRYFRSEDRIPYPAPAKTVKMSDDLEVEVSPTFAFYGTGTVEAVKIKTGKPMIKQESADENLQVQALLRYAESLVDPGETRIVRGSVYYLRKTSDRNGRKPHFDEDFFGEGGNVVSAAEIYTADGSCGPMDELIKSTSEKYMEGVSEDECDPNDCRVCSLRDMCSRFYSSAPLHVSKELGAKAPSAIMPSPAQMEIIGIRDGITRVNAGAGTGKTSTVVLRVLELLLSGVDPEKILMVTFTSAAAEEMRERIRVGIDDYGIDADADKMWICTFNALGDEIIKENYRQIGFTQEPRVIDAVERSAIIAEIINRVADEAEAKGEENPLKDLDWRNFDIETPNCKGALPMAKKVFGLIKDRVYTRGDAECLINDLGPSIRFASRKAVESLLELYDDFDAALRDNALIEFSDQGLMIFEILMRNPDYLEERFGFQHIIIDEFQDSDKFQVRLIRDYFCNCRSFRSLMVVGDDSQGIYGFRNTSPEYMINFPKIMGRKVRDCYLLNNYRSTPQIIDFANGINSLNRYKVAKELLPVREPGKKVKAHGFLSAEEEREFVASEIEKRLEDGEKPENIAVLAATKAELLKMADELAGRNIPAVLMNPENFLDNSRVKGALALIRAVKNPDDTEDLMIYANVLIRGGLLKEKAETAIFCMESAEGYASEIRSAADPAEKKEKLLQALHDLDENQDEVYERFLEKIERRSWQKLLDYCGEFEKYGGKEAFRREHDYPGIVLTTAHSSKGLEWPVCYAMISGFDRKEYHAAKDDPFEVNPRMSDSVEEARRLLFVSCTRARDELVITSKYVTHSARGSYMLNIFLKNCYDVSGQEYSAEKVIKAAEKRKAEERRKRKEEKKKKKENTEVIKNVSAAKRPERTSAACR